jgi:hypothetical protein
MGKRPDIAVNVIIPRRSPEGDLVRHVFSDPPKTLPIGTTVVPVFRRVGHKRQGQVNLIGWVITDFPRTRRKEKLLTEHQWHLCPGRYEPWVARYDPALRRFIVLAEELYKPRFPSDTWRPKDGNPLNLLRSNLRPATKRHSRQGRKPPLKGSSPALKPESPLPAGTLPVSRSSSQTGRSPDDLSTFRDHPGN